MMTDQTYMYFSLPRAGIVKSIELGINSYVNGLPFLLFLFSVSTFSQPLLHIRSIRSQIFYELNFKITSIFSSPLFFFFFPILHLNSKYKVMAVQIKQKTNKKNLANIQ